MTKHDAGSITILFALIGLVVGPPIIYGVGRWIGRPLDQAAKMRERRTQFTIVDFLCLFVLVQPATALIHMIKTGETGSVTPGVPYILDAYAWAAIGAVWWKCCGIMSRAGIDRPWHRIVLIVFVLPITLVGPMTPFVLTMITSIGMVQFASARLFVLTMVLIVIGAVAGLFLAAWLTRKIVAESEVGVGRPLEELCEAEPGSPD
jgi:hypothetical protein